MRQPREFLQLFSDKRLERIWNLVLCTYRLLLDCSRCFLSFDCIQMYFAVRPSLLRRYRVIFSLLVRQRDV